MLKLTDQLHRNLAFWGLALIALGLPLSVFMVSVGTIVLAVNWLLEGNYLSRLQQFFKDPLSLFIVSVFLLYLVGMLYTENFAQGLKDLRIKLPILVLPLFLFTSKLPDKKKLQDVLILFVIGCVIGTALGTIHYLGFTNEDVANKRELSVVISHIRFSLMITFAIFILAYYLAKLWKDWSVIERGLTIVSICWLFFFMVLLEAATAYLAFSVLISLTLLRLLFKSRKALLKLLIACLILTGAVGTLIYANSIYKNHISEVPFDYRTLTVKTLNGNYYAHQKDVPYRENGHRVWNFVCLKELEQNWSTKSDVPFDGFDQRGQPIKFTAIRYMTSLGLRKDSVALTHLNTLDVSNIERGFTNYKYTDKWGVSRRLAQFLWELEEYEYNQNANHSSLLQRWVYFKVGLSIISENLLFGVGTGDITDKYNKAYSINDYGLLPELHAISHNQFLTVAIVLGIVGLIGFIVALGYPFLLYYNDYLYLMFFALMISSFLTDNTLNSQSGVTLFAFFNALLIVRKEFEDE